MKQTNNRGERDMRKPDFVFHTMGDTNAVVYHTKRGVLRMVPVEYTVKIWLARNNLRTIKVWVGSEGAPGFLHRLHFVQRERWFVCQENDTILRLCVKDARRLLTLKKRTRRFTLCVE